MQEAGGGRREGVAHSVRNPFLRPYNTAANKVSGFPR